MKSDKETFYKNRGVERNKKPLRNELYKFEVKPLKEGLTEDELKGYEQYKFKEEGYIVMLWSMQGWDYWNWNWHGFVTPEYVKEKIGVGQWDKFCRGKREFTIQRRVDGKNVKKKKDDTNV